MFAVGKSTEVGVGGGGGGGGGSFLSRSRCNVPGGVPV